MGKKKVEHVVFDGMRQIKKKVNISKYNQNAQKNFLRKRNMEDETYEQEKKEWKKGGNL
jgi:hypothetical protein